MRRQASNSAPPPPLPPGEGRAEGAVRGFSLVELMVALGIVLVLMTLGGAAISAARVGSAKQRTQATIATIDAILQQHFSSREAHRIGAALAGGDWGARIRRQITADMPDNWAEVQQIRRLRTEFNSPRHRAYVTIWNQLNPTNDFGEAECLFMILTQGGLADCLACGGLENVRKGDKDGDGALEFWDEWDEPIRYVLWPAGFELPRGQRFFSPAKPFGDVGPTGTAGRTVRPLVFSGGPSRMASTAVHAGSYLRLGDACGDPSHGTIAGLGGFAPVGTNQTDFRGDNITNFDGEVKR